MVLSFRVVLSIVSHCSGSSGDDGYCKMKPDTILPPPLQCPLLIGKIWVYLLEERHTLAVYYAVVSVLQTNNMVNFMFTIINNNNNIYINIF